MCAGQLRMKNFAGFSEASSLAKLTTFRSHADVDAAVAVHRVGRAIHSDCAGTAGVDGSELAAFEEGRATGFLVIGQDHGGIARHGSGDDQAVEIGEESVEASGMIELGNKEGFADFLGGHARHFLWSRHTADGGFEHGGLIGGCSPECKACRTRVEEKFNKQSITAGSADFSVGIAVPDRAPGKFLFASRLGHSGHDPAMNDSISSLTARIQSFVDARDWRQFHNPKDLAVAISAEAGELMQHFVWQQDGQIEERVRKNRDEIASEIADVGILLFEFADNLGFKLGDVMAAKMANNEERYPVAKSKGNNLKYSEL
jgi:dCTP diphosphatase